MLLLINWEKWWGKKGWDLWKIMIGLQKLRLKPKFFRLYLNYSKVKAFFSSSLLPIHQQRQNFCLIMDPFSEKKHYFKLGLVPFQSVSSLPYKICCFVLYSLTELLSWRTTNFMGYCPLVAQWLPLVDLHHFPLTKEFPKSHSAI